MDVLSKRTSKIFGTPTAAENEMLPISNPYGIDSSRNEMLPISNPYWIDTSRNEMLTISNPYGIDSSRNELLPISNPYGIDSTRNELLPISNPYGMNYHEMIIYQSRRDEISHRCSGGIKLSHINLREKFIPISGI